MDLKEWTWSDECPYPETLGTIVDVKMACGSEIKGQSVRHWRGHAHKPDESYWHPFAGPAQITHYRVQS
ncbi:hypothetical protein [Limoniibacter endophyticus]|uniref:Uncharacterized protein n=1 Tax=Limoniibacter endophyticus TaxID=1565040 RepID=A0A8J3GGP9_9HYPH|nr:hypothetical protein [Limoniibacter endophyticus]GHC61513.1 hypothetical protein GCM10010136_02100 [Limoniibacter endophyticus]